MKIDLLNNENPLQPSSERQGEKREQSNEVMKEQTARRFARWRRKSLWGAERMEQRKRRENRARMWIRGEKDRSQDGGESRVLHTFSVKQGT